MDDQRLEPMFALQIGAHSIRMARPVSHHEEDWLFASRLQITLELPENFDTCINLQPVSFQIVFGQRFRRVLDFADLGALDHLISNRRRQRVIVDDMGEENLVVASTSVRRG